MRQKKIGIVTIHGHNNYGGALQEFALQRVLCQLGYQPETVNYVVPGFVQKKGRLKLFVDPRAYIRGFGRWCYIRCHQRDLEQTNHQFQEFYQKGRNLSSRYETIAEIPADCDAYITGSDQVWSPRLRQSNYISCFALEFVPSEKRISYAASGISQLLPGEENTLRNSLKSFAFLSVREDGMAQLLGDLLERPVEHVLDPTLLPSAATWLEWIEPFAQFSPPTEPYILCYAISGVHRDIAKKALHAAKKFADAKKIKVFAPIMRSYEGYAAWEEGVTPLFVGPAQFVKLVHGATAMVTTSFHATAFSINFRKPFLIFSDSDNSVQTGNARFSSILRQFQFPDRTVKTVDEAMRLGLEMDFTHVDQLQERWRVHSLDFLKRSLEKCTQDDPKGTSHE